AELRGLNLLRRVFLKEPGKDLLEEIEKMNPAPAEGEELEGLLLMCSAARRNEGRLPEWAEQLSLEFARLFLGPAHPPAIPYASFYLSESRSLMTEETLDVRKRYLEAGLVVKDLHRIPDDHIGIELDFLYYLTTRYLELSEIGQGPEAEHFLKIRHDFLKDHFTLWAPLFADRILESTQEEFYRGTASFLLELVDYYQNV
ncbi:MAG: molecular chaperone TorD family protein, partial [Deltaproteobacteria bacterium]|nr:molecular chaperone TorD family protein [Deltaproteobacteria bacterium]